jgi:hypothetical protein
MIGKVLRERFLPGSAGIPLPEAPESLEVLSARRCDSPETRLRAAALDERQRRRRPGVAWPPGAASLAKDAKHAKDGAGMVRSPRPQGRRVPRFSGRLCVLGVLGETPGPRGLPVASVPPW